MLNVCTINQESQTNLSKKGAALIEELKASVTKKWFEFVDEKNLQQKNRLLQQYRELKRKYELQLMIAA